MEFKPYSDNNSIYFPPTEMAPDDLRRRRPTDFTVKSSVSSLNDF